jgi:hypothetical protein
MSIPYVRKGADGRTEYLCRTCGYTPTFAPSAVARRLRQCAPCARRSRAAHRRAARANTIAATLRQRELRAGRASLLTSEHVALHLRASRFRSVWPAAESAAASDASDADAAAGLTIDRIDLARALALENALVLTERQARMRRARVDPLPPQAREIATAIAHTVAVAIH